MAGEIKIATRRIASSASPSTRVDGAARLHLPGRVGLQVGVRRPDQFPGRFQGALGREVLPRVRGSGGVASATARRVESLRGAGPTPSHFDVTTAATRATRLPRLFARSVL